MIRGNDGYIGDDEVAQKGIGRLNVLDLQIQIRRLPKPVIAMVAGYAIGGGHVLHVVCDPTIAADNARFGQTGPKVGSFDGGYGSGLLARIVGQKRAREVWYLCRQYGAEQAYDWGLVNEVVPLADLEQATVAWAQEMLALSPLALRLLKASHNAADDGLAGVQQLAGDSTLLFYMTEEAQEGRNAYTERRAPDFDQFPVARDRGSATCWLVHGWCGCGWSCPSAACASGRASCCRGRPGGASSRRSPSTGRGGVVVAGLGHRVRLRGVAAARAAPGGVNAIVPAVTPERAAAMSRCRGGPRVSDRQGQGRRARR